jgi:hypothetical protein
MKHSLDCSAATTNPLQSRHAVDAGAPALSTAAAAAAAPHAGTPQTQTAYLRPVQQLAQSQHISRLEQQLERQEQQLARQHQQLHLMEGKAMELQRLQARQQQRPQCQQEQKVAALWLDKTAVPWPEDLLDMPMAGFRAIIATSPGMSPALCNQLELARTRKRNRQHARSSRDRLRRHAGSDQQVRGRYAQKIGTLQSFNSALRSSLVASQRASAPAFHSSTNSGR